MAIYNTPDGRQIVGQTTPGNNYHGYNGKRDIIIQLTATGATEDGLNALEYLKAYAIEHNAQGDPIFPNGARVWISTNGYTKAVEADDIVIDGSNVTIGGIVWNGSAWDYTNAGQSGGGGGGVLAVHQDFDGQLDKTWQEIANATASTGAVIAFENEGTVAAAHVITSAYYNLMSERYIVETGESSYITTSTSGYPTIGMGGGSDTPVS